MFGVHRQTRVSLAELWDHFVDRDQLLRAVIGKRAKQHRIGDGENGRVRSQPQGQNSNSSYRKSGTSPQASNSLAKIGKERFHEYDYASVILRVPSKEAASALTR